MIEVSTFTNKNEQDWNVVLSVNSEKNNIEQYGDFSEQQSLDIMVQK